MRKLAKLDGCFLVGWLILGASGCDDAGERSHAAASTPLPIQCEPADAALGDADSAELFDSQAVAVFDLHLPEADWEELKASAAEEVYVPVTACYNGRLLGQVGLRFKGSYGTLYGCLDEQGRQVCKKLSMKLRFDEFEPELRLFGLKRLNFNSLVHDFTYLHERLGYDLYRAMGVPAPRASWATLRVNGESQGLFGMVEQVDGRFTADRWPDHPDGNLFKEVWPGINTDPAYVAEHLSTNGEAARVDAFVNFSEAMLNAPESERAKTLEGFWDLQRFARYMAVDDAINNVDGVTAIYTDPGSDWYGNHNYYIYEAAPDSFLLIPWDLDATFNLSSGYGAVPHWTQTPDDCLALYSVWGEAHVRAPGCDPLLTALASDLSEYQLAVDELLSGAFSHASMVAAIDAHARFIREAVADDPNGPGLEPFESNIGSLKDSIPSMRERVAFLASGETFEPLLIQPGSVNDFENASGFAINSSTLLLANPSSSVRVVANEVEPLGGLRDLLLSFEYRNEAAPWEQWTFFRIDVASGSIDATALSGVRLRLRADQARSLRLDVESPAHTATELGIRFGWDVAVDNQSALVEVLFEDVQVPSWAVDQRTDPGDERAAILSTVTGLAFHPECVGRDAAGMLPEGGTDAGWLAIDDVELF